MSMMSATTQIAVPLVPGKRGGRRVVCHGTFVSMHKGAGWIKPIEEIDHPLASWNQGDIYLSQRDVLPGVTLEAGDSVVFHLYADSKGLGAQNCVQVWHEKAKSMRASRGATEISLAPAFVPSPADVAFVALASMAAASVLQPPAVSAPPGLTPMTAAVDLSTCYDDSADSDDEESDDDAANAVKISLADALPLGEPPSKGSVLHAEGNCKRCSFFPKGACTNGADCDFCHFEHEKRPQNHKRKRLWRERQREKAQLARSQNAKIAAARSTLEEPMKIDSILINLPKHLLPAEPGNKTPTSTYAGSADERDLPSTPNSSVDEGSIGTPYLASQCDSPPFVEREPCLESGKFLPPTSRKTPPPGFPPPPMPEFLSEVSERVKQVTSC